MLRHSSGLSEEYQNADKEDIVRASRNFLRRLLIGCIQDTQTRLENRQDEAVQFWFRRDDRMCWLIPLRLGVTEEVNLALVLEPSQLNGVPVYRAHTVLALKEAFKCARLLGPVRAEEEARYVWLRKENIMEIHGGKTMLTFLDSTKDYKLYDEQNRVMTTQKGTELYTHYDKVESSVRERYEKVQKQQKKTAQKKTVTTKKAR